MIIIPQKITMKWSHRNKSYYISKGYEYTNMNDTFSINVLDLPEGSKQKVECVCDYCSKKYFAEFKQANPNKKVKYLVEKKCCCMEKKCWVNKVKESNLEKYGVDNTSKINTVKEKIKNTNLERYNEVVPTKNQEIKQKVKQTCIEKYGVENPYQSKEIREKIKNTWINKYGVDNPNKLESTKLKSKQTKLKKYGDNNPLHSISTMEKIKHTCLERYGVEHPLQNEEIRAKGVKTLYKNKTGVSSKPQRYLCNLLNGELNYPVGICKLDIAFPYEMLYIEYDGSGHNLSVKRGQISEEDFYKNEINRQYFLKKEGWKLIRIISSKDILLNDNKIIELINECRNYLLNFDHSWIKIDIDNMKIICNEYEKNIMGMKL